jgi:phosphoinositide-3-kinase regulatory subunit 4
MELVENLTPVNSHVFPNYILPKISPYSENNNTLVRATFAACLASLAKSAGRFLDMTQASQADGALPIQDPDAEDGGDPDATMRLLFDGARTDLISYFQNQSKILLTDQSSAVRRAYLKSVGTLCVFFGRTKANDTILSHLNTYLNDKDWMLRCAFFDTVTGIATYLGGVALEEYIMPLMVQSLTDPEEFVVEKVLKALSTMAELGLFQRTKTWELVDVVGRFMIHPSIWIREAAVGFISSSTRWLSPSEIHCILYPLIRPFLEAQIAEYTTTNLLEMLKKPVSLFAARVGVCN